MRVLGQGKTKKKNGNKSFLRQRYGRAAVVLSPGSITETHWRMFNVRLSGGGGTRY